MVFLPVGEKPMLLLVAASLRVCNIAENLSLETIPVTILGRETV